MPKFSKQSQKGFTVVEMLTAASLFGVIMLTFGQVFISALGLQRRAFDIQQIEENTSVILESMIKEVRVGQVALGDSNCPNSPATSLTITHPVNGTIVYFLSGTDVHRQVSGIDTIVNSNTVEFTRLNFCVTGSPLGDQRQPRITIIASVKGKGSNQAASMDFQTAVSQRFFVD